MARRRTHAKEARQLAEDIQSGLNTAWCLAPDRQAVIAQETSTAKLMFKSAPLIVMALRYYAAASKKGRE